MSTTDSDELLLKRYLAGHTEAFEVLVTRYQTQVFNYLLRSTRDQATAEELLQDTWMSVLKRAGTFKEDSKFSTWLYAIARNKCIDRSRKMRFRRHRSLDAATGQRAEAPVERVVAPQVPVDQAAAAPALRTRIARAVEALPDEQREVFLLRQLQGMAYADIAEVVGCGTNTAKSRMRYALERLQEVLAADRASEEVCP